MTGPSRENLPINSDNKAKEGIGRGLFCYRQGRRIIVLHVFVKKGQKLPKKDLELAKKLGTNVTAAFHRALSVEMPSISVTALASARSIIFTRVD
ncbi:MAG: type II toxin-antitoxin system RelE/ParE family toxin [Marinobacter sp.]|nr:type II toxin-antitoxin system RelE/ParE family toxin [Marinobacter sp.]